MRRSLAAFLLLLALPCLAARAQAIHVSFSTGDGIDVRGDRVVLKSSGEPNAEISAGGALRVGGHRVATGERERVLLERYNRRVHRIEDQAISIGLDGAEVGITAVAAAVVAVFTGNGDHVERVVEPKAADLKERARRLCAEVEELRALQDEIAERVPQFRPYALMDDERPQCRVDD